MSIDILSATPALEVTPTPTLQKIIERSNREISEHQSKIAKAQATIAAAQAIIDRRIPNKVMEGVQPLKGQEDNP